MKPSNILSLTSFVSAIYVSLTAYISTSFLASFMPASATGLVISTGAALALLVLPFAPSLIARIGAQRLALVLTIAQGIVLFSLAATPSVSAAIALVALLFAMTPLISYCLDLLLEATVVNEGVTGRVRTLYLTAYNFSAALIPFSLVFLLGNSEDYALVFFVAGLSILPLILIIAFAKLPRVQPFSLSSISAAVRCVLGDKDIVAVSIASFALHLFFAWSPLFIPLYLHLEIGIPWSQLGWILAVGLLPYAIVEYPAGLFADTYGDKFLMVSGFVIAGIALALVGTITKETSLITILLILVMSRVGTAFAEAMTESHFFRRVSEHDLRTVSAYRILWPLASLIAPIVAGFLLAIGGFALLFIIIGFSIAAIGGTAAFSTRELRSVTVAKNPLAPLR